MNSLLRSQFEKERQLARMIYAARPVDRPAAYFRAYKELYELFPNIATNEAEEVNRARTTRAFLARFLTSSAQIVEVGAGRCHLVRELAPLVRYVIALDVTLLSDGRDWPANAEHRLFDGLTIDLPEASVDLAISDNVIEHLHPDDALPQLRELRRILRPGAAVAILTPNKANGPHDISAEFTPAPEGLHLKEYSTRDMATLLRTAGFARIRTYIGFGGRYFSIYPVFGTCIEAVLGLLPRRLLRRRQMRWLLPNRFTAVKS